MQTIPFLDIRTSNACNFRCLNCTHFAGGEQGLVLLDEAEAWMQAWQHRLQPEIFGLLGGEPTLNPQLCDFLVLARRCWPKSTLHLTTNGFFLSRHPNLPETLEKTDTAIYLTKHDSSPYYILPFERSWKPSRRRASNTAFPIPLPSCRGRMASAYHGTGEYILPFEDGNPRKSWEECPRELRSTLPR